MIYFQAHQKLPLFHKKILLLCQMVQLLHNPLHLSLIVMIQINFHLYHLVLHHQFLEYVMYLYVSLSLIYYFFLFIPYSFIFKFCYACMHCNKIVVKMNLLIDQCNQIHLLYCLYKYYILYKSGKSIPLSQKWLCYIIKPLNRKYTNLLASFQYMVYSYFVEYLHN